MSSTRRETALRYLKGFEALSFDSFSSIFTPTFQHTFAPASASPPPPLSKEEFIAHINHLRDVLEAFPVIAKDVIEDKESSRVVIYATSVTHFHNHLKDEGIAPQEWVYRGEYVFILTMDETGTKIESVFEFLDSKGTDRLRELMARARGNM